MATLEVTNLTDDLDSRIVSGVETVVFYDPETGEKLEIELGEANRKHLKSHIEKLEKYVAVARVVEKPQPVRKSTPKTASETAQVRAWGKANGFAVGDRGRIKPEVFAAYAKSKLASVEAVASTELDGDTQVINEAPENFTVEVTNPETGETEQFEVDFDMPQPMEMSDEEILSMLGEIDAETGGDFTLDDVANKVDNKTE